MTTPQQPIQPCGDEYASAKASSDSGRSNKHPGPAPNKLLDDENELAINTTIERGEQKYSRLGWKRLTICMIVEAVALGSLSIPSAFATLGLVPGILITVGLGLIAIYTSYLIGLVKLKFSHVAHYADAVGLIWGRFGKELAGFMFAALLILSTGSHALTGSIALSTISSRSFARPQSDCLTGCYSELYSYSSICYLPGHLSCYRKLLVFRLISCF